ncbi:hypothetical protein F4V43_18180 [Paenibacillus spiritus]|uniref:ABC transporter permease n=1 Tax=Paenibacillus spiritus TaxID=2496557 RepID=A0A5J5FUK5_9BACL|nr:MULTISPECIES: hypothetical protein [Paenibacillus]KAA8997219.1 hypothetical protein F4V43_18180 [Paenibacillus spiritus]
MSTMREAWFLLKSEMMGTRMRIIKVVAFSLVMMGYFGLFTGVMLQERLKDQDPMIIADYLLLLTVPMLGFVYCRRSLRYWGSDVYTKTLSYLRTLPVPSKAVLCKRQLQSLLAFCLNGLIFFGLLYALSPDARHSLPPAAYLAFVLAWIGYGLVITSVFIHFEMAHSGRMYFVAMVVLVALIAGVAGAVGLSGGNLLLFSARLCRDRGLASPLPWGMLSAGAASLLLMGRWTLQRLKRRDLA